jgi:hypothetical protein
MPYYGKSKEMEHLMRQWTAAIADSGVEFQQMDPVTGEFTLKESAGHYSPTALVYIDFSCRLGGGKILG